MHTIEGDADGAEKRSARGVLSEYADPKLWEQEEGAWKRAAAEKYKRSARSLHLENNCED